MDDVNEKEHKIEDQWHFPIMTKFGFTSLDNIKIGLVRYYEYTKGDHKVSLTTGASADYFSDKKHSHSGYWSELEPHLNKIYNDKENSN